MPVWPGSPGCAAFGADGYDSSFERFYEKKVTSRRPTVLLIVDRWVAGGISKHIEDLCESFAVKGLDCIVAAWLAPGEQPPADIDFHHLPLFNTNGRKTFLGFWRSQKSLRNLLVDKRVDIIHMHNRYVTMLAAVASRGLVLGRVYTLHNIFHDLRFLPWYPKNVICLNEAGRQAFLRNYFLPRELRVRVIPNGVDIESGRVSEFRHAKVATFAYVGRLEKPKGVDLLVRAVSALNEVDVRVLIAGSGKEEGALRALTHKLGLDGKIEFLGHVDNPDRILDESIALIMPATRLEGFGYVVIEAFARHRAVIASDLGAFDETVIDGVTGIRFKSDDHLSLADALRRAMDDAGELKTMGENGFLLVCEKFSRQRMVEATLDVYQSLLGSELSFH